MKFGSSQELVILFVSQENSRLQEELNVAYTKVRITNLNRRFMISSIPVAFLMDDHIGTAKICTRK